MNLEKKRPWAIAHRGALLEAPENTLIAFQRAIDLGADLIELDVRLTQDEHIVVHHDELLERTTNGSGAIQDWSLAALKSLDAGSWKGNNFASVRIPTLAEVFALVTHQVKLAIEVKVSGVQSPTKFATQLVDLIQQSAQTDNVIIISEDLAAIQTIRGLNHDIPTACFVQGTPAHWQVYRQQDSQGDWPSDYLFTWPDEVSREMVQAIHQAGLRVITSLERQQKIEAEQIYQLAEAGLDGILANDIGKLVHLLQSTIKM